MTIPITSYSKSYDVIMVGAGHAGVEAALAAARMGCRTLLLTMNLDTIAHMPCNCSIGGPAKGHVVREIDAMGGEMGRAIDATLTHIRMLNTSKGPAVQALRAQADKNLYHLYMKHAVERQDRLDVKQSAVAALLVEDSRIFGIQTKSGIQYLGACVVMTTGTFLRGLTHMGEVQQSAGRAGEAPSVEASQSLENLGIRLGRLKTGTTARIDKKTVDFSKVETQESEPDVPPFSFLNDRVETPRPLLPAWLTHTNDETHQIIRGNLGRSAMYGGRIQGVGPRYCPSIEDKVVRFPEKDRHSVFLEQEGWDTVEMYVQGMSTSLPEEVQIAFLRTLPGLEEVEVMRPGYAVEYDFVPPDQLLPTLETKAVKGLYFAGQINGTSGYEEAAGQGIVAGINAALRIQDREPLVLSRSQSYIGVMIDDLVTKGVDDPYRLLTSRAEHRLLLRQDNADERLTPVGREIGLVDDARWELFHVKQELMKTEAHRLRQQIVRPTAEVQRLLSEMGADPMAKPLSLAELLRRSNLDYSLLSPLDPERPDLPAHVEEQVEIEIKYEGYIKRQE
ncbi:MAG: tRNA uridine-5-carboxymethylaminomethyl(34) synthesis enzyme MnmG [Armatimonadetes bacterium]|nr:tRNA uridine-5-carboxymethylaminomethyl(34) synthesis enzyme MnmG [Armatimonadota bacterium]